MCLNLVTSDRVRCLPWILSDFAHESLKKSAGDVTTFRYGEGGSCLPMHLALDLQLSY